MHFKCYFYPRIRMVYFKYFIKSISPGWKYIFMLIFIRGRGPTLLYNRIWFLSPAFTQRNTVDTSSHLAVMTWLPTIDNDNRVCRETTTTIIIIRSGKIGRACKNRSNSHSGYSAWTYIMHKYQSTRRSVYIHVYQYRYTYTGCLTTIWNLIIIITLHIKNTIMEFFRS